MSTTSLNPNHQTALAISDHWNKIAAFLVHKAGGHVVITHSDLDSAPREIFITLQEEADGLHLRLVDKDTANRLAREHGGLPT
jgi:hypothetical protein